MLRRIWWQGVRSACSDEGYSVRLRGLKYGLEYREGAHVAQICVETAAVEVDWIIYILPPIAWLPPHEHELISEEKRLQIRERIVAALDFLGIKYRLAE